ncbi:MAG: hypothetical protein D3914_05035 [Candidatus Electrothrix sp. LOE2]|nr:hypothetical protein [Candidatus Electrothrix sp. LOE2]
MSKNFFLRLCIIVAGTFLPVLVGQVQAQQPEGAVVEEKVQKKDVFSFGERIISNLEGRIPDGKFEQVGDLKGKEFSESGLSEALKAIAFSEEEIETVLNLVHERQQFVESIKKAAPVALAMNKVKADIRTQEDILGKTHQEDEKKKLSKELRKQHGELRKHESTLAGIMQGIDATDAERIAAVLKAAGHESDEVDIISRHIVNHALFAKKIGTLSDMTDSIDAINKEINEYEGRLENAGSDEQKKNISAYLTELNDRQQKTKNDFSILTTGIDYSTFLKKEGKEVDWEKELKEIFSPIIVELRETTERPRKMERLRSQMLYLEKRTPQVRQAAEDLGKLLEKVTDKKVRTRLESWQEYWIQLEKELVTQSEAAKNQLIKEENDRKSVFTSFKIFFDSFVKHRGKSLFFALLAFVGIYLAFRLLQRMIWKISPIHKSSKYMFWANLVDVMFYALTFLAATGALVAVLFTSGDWLILAVVMLLVLGIIWGARNTLPHFIEQIKLLLGFGPVRQGERIKIDGISYRVEMMGVYSYLKNPLLTGGTLRLPLKDLVGMRSRPYDEEEPWFPCAANDFVLLPGGAWRQITIQTPDFIELYNVGGQKKSMLPTAKFMQMEVINLSRQSFFVGFNSRINIKHRALVFDEVPKQITAMLKEEMPKLPYMTGDDVEEYWVTFDKYDSAALEICVYLLLPPKLAAKYTPLKRAIIQTTFKAANRYGWEIPVVPLEMHSAAQNNLLVENGRPSFSE